jgi:enoyl-[acyl-carrier protein] reductase I
MGFLQGKKLLITGVLSNRSIAYGIAAPAMRKGLSWLLATWASASKTASPSTPPTLAPSWCLTATWAATSKSPNCSPTSQPLGRSSTALCTPSVLPPARPLPAIFLDGLSREAFKIAHDISAYSFPAMAKAALPLLRDKSALLTLTYLGAIRTVPNYNTMGLAKASLEASVRYLAESLGPKGVRVNGISAGPIKTLAASGIKGFGKLLSVVAETLAHPPQRHH